MIVISLTAFWGALLGIVLFFALKFFGIRKDFSCCVSFRRRADILVLYFESLLFDLWSYIEKMPTFGYFMTKITHVSASLIASLAGLVERKAHTLADWAARRDIQTDKKTQSVFLQKVGEHKKSL